MWDILFFYMPLSEGRYGSDEMLKTIMQLGFNSPATGVMEGIVAL